jgi:outer membrane protein
VVNPNIDYSANNYQLQLRQPLYNRASQEIYEQSKLQVAVSEVQFDQARSDLIIRVSQAYFDVLAAQDTIAFIQAQRIAIAEQLASAKRNFEVGTATITDTHEAQARYDLSNAQEIAAQNDLEVKRNAFAQITGKLPPALSHLKSGLTLNPPEPAAMDAWVQSAESGNFGVVAQSLLAEIAKLDISRNRAGHLPTVDAVATHGRNTSFFNTAFTTTTTSVGVQLTVPLFSGYATSSKIREAISLEDKARSDVDTARRNAAQNVRTAYFGVQSGLSQVRALEAAEISSKSALESNRLGYEVGVRINIDVLNAQQQLYSTRRDLAKARYETLMNSLRLKAAAGNLSEADLARFNELFDIR